MLALVEKHEIAQAEQVDRLEQAMLDMPQAECPVVHHFGPGTYVREVTLPAGTIAIGHAQRFEQLNIMLTGKVAIIGNDGKVKELTAPMIFVGPPGRKIGYVIETTTWLNVYATDERDIEKLEAHFLDKSPAWLEHSVASHMQKTESHQKDRDDFALVIEQAGFNSETVRKQSENEEDQIAMPAGQGIKVTIRPSAIDGSGVFLSSPAEAGEVIAPARINGMRTPAGRFTNHSLSPNAKFVKTDNGDIYLMATQRISGCAGGNAGEEVTVDYRQALELSGIRLPTKGENQ
jgi:hypothetical protein